MDQPAAEAVLIGQNGKRLTEGTNTNSISYLLREADHYGRAEFAYANGTRVFLNPVYFIPSTGYAEIPVRENFLVTVPYRIVGIALLGFWLIFVIRKMTGRGRLRLRTSRRSIAGSPEKNYIFLSPATSGDATGRDGSNKHEIYFKPSAIISRDCLL